MSQATLKFKLPEEEEEFLCAVNGYRYKLIISEQLNFLRNKIKYGEISPEQKTVYEEIRNSILEAVQEIGAPGDF